VNLMVSRRKQLGRLIEIQILVNIKYYAKKV